MSAQVFLREEIMVALWELILNNCVLSGGFTCRQIRDFRSSNLCHSPPLPFRANPLPPPWDTLPEHLAFDLSPRSVTDTGQA